MEIDSHEIFADEVIDLTIDTVGAGHRLGPDELALSQTRVTKGFIVRPNDFIEVQDVHFGSYKVDFVRIEIITQQVRTGRTTIHGIPFTRTRNLKTIIPVKSNEVCMLLHFNRNGNEEEPLLVDVSIESVVQKRSLVTTNAVYPEHRSDSTPYSHVQPEARRLRKMETFGRLVCRWQLKVYFTVQGRRTKPDEEAIMRIHASDVKDDRYRVSEDTLCNRWRGTRVKGGSCCPTMDNSINIDLENAVNSSGVRARNQKYTVFDSFSGAGGVSRGAQSAGFKIEFAVDNSTQVWETYSTNFPDTTLYKMAVDQFIRDAKRQRTRVDVLHLSPPCQFFSPAHTRPSAHDDENIFALFSCNELINKTRPRLITLEQTFGITHERHIHFFKTVISDFTQFGYSVRWKVVRLCTWGSAQDRKRVVLIAAGPGERLPPFPEPTHSASGVDGLKPLTTIRQALRNIQFDDDRHDIAIVKRHHPSRLSYDPNRLAMTITTGGGESHHPSGTRDFTLRELASLQGFPRHHRFRGTRTSVKKQIGNAFPPNTVRVLYSHLEEWLLKEDGMRRYELPPDNVFMIDDDSSDASEIDLAGLSEHGESPGMDDVMEVDVDDFQIVDLIDLT